MERDAIAIAIAAGDGGAAAGRAKKPINSRKSVVLPEPFGPKRPKTSPCWTVSVH